MRCQRVGRELVEYEGWAHVVAMMRLNLSRTQFTLSRDRTAATDQLIIMTFGREPLYFSLALETSILIMGFVSLGPPESKGQAFHGGCLCLLRGYDWPLSRREYIRPAFRNC